VSRLDLLVRLRRAVADESTIDVEDHVFAVAELVERALEAQKADRRKRCLAAGCLPYAAYRAGSVLELEAALRRRSPQPLVRR